MNIIIFGPNGSGKGTQGAVIKKKFNLPHVETGVLFREHKKKQTTFGKDITRFIDKGELVPDALTISMLWARLEEEDCKRGWLLDGFPRNLTQSESLYESMKERNISLDYLIEIKLDREIAKSRLMGRRTSSEHPDIPYNINIPEIAPPQNEKGEYICRESGTVLEARADDIDEAAINKRHNIYYNAEFGTLAAVDFLKEQVAPKGCKIIELDGKPSIKEVTKALEDVLV